MVVSAAEQKNYVVFETMSHIGQNDARNVGSRG